MRVTIILSSYVVIGVDELHHILLLRFKIKLPLVVATVFDQEVLRGNELLDAVVGNKPSNQKEKERRQLYR